MEKATRALCLAIAFLFVIAVLTACNGTMPSPAVPTQTPIIASAITTGTAMHIPIITPASTATPAPTATPLGGGTGRIAFVANNSGSSGINLINADGTGLTHLAIISGNIGLLTWLPTGKEMSFMSYASGKQQAYLLSLDGSNPRPFTSVPTDTILVAWSPNFQKVAFIRGSFYTQTQVYVMNADGSGLLNLAPKPDNYLSIGWFPDGSRLTFSANHAFVANVDGSGIITVAEDLPYVLQSAWSPNGQKLALVGTVTNTIGVYLANADGKSTKMLANWPISSTYSFSGLVWSPDSQKIVFTIGSGDASSSTVYLITTDSPGSKRVTSAGRNWSYAWSPDGRLAAVSSSQGGKNKICIMDPDVGNLKCLTDDIGDDFNPAWQP